MRTNLYWRPHHTGQDEETGFSPLVMKLVQAAWGTPAVLCEVHFDTLRAWAIFARTLAGGDWPRVDKEVGVIIALIEKHGSIELYEY